MFKPKVARLTREEIEAEQPKLTQLSGYDRKTNKLDGIDIDELEFAYTSGWAPKDLKKSPTIKKYVSHRRRLKKWVADYNTWSDWNEYYSQTLGKKLMYILLTCVIVLIPVLIFVRIMLNR